MHRAERSLVASITSDTWLTSLAHTRRGWTGRRRCAGRGINGIHLFWDERRWWVVTIMWDAESPTQPIPANYRRTKMNLGERDGSAKGSGTKCSIWFLTPLFEIHGM